MCYLLIGLIIVHVIPPSFAIETKQKIVTWDYPLPGMPYNHTSIDYLAYKSNEYVDLFQDENKLSLFLDKLKSLGVNTITMPVAWSEIEPKEGHYTFDKYDKTADLITSKGFKLIILPKGVNNGSPGWFWKSIEKQGRKGMATDFYKIQYPLLDIASDEAIKPFLDFYGNTTAHFISKYKNSILAIGVGTSNEYEIRYSQFHYQWQTYSDESEIKFQKWLAERYSLVTLNKTWKTHYDSFDKVKLPIIDHNANGYSGAPDTNANFTDLMQFREELLYNFTQKLSSTVKEQGADTIGYLGEFFITDDAIYTSMIDKIVGLLDVVVVDTNFYNGFKISDHDLKGAIMVNFAKNLGYKKVLLGVYGERLSPDYDGNLVTSYIQNAFTLSNPDGVEIGNFRPSELNQWSFLNNIPSLISKDESHGNATIAIYASKWNFYRWHGDIMSFNRDLWSDSLYSTYQILAAYKGYQVDVIGDSVIENHGLQKYQMLYLPSQVVVPLKIKSTIEQWIDGGGYAVQDWQFGNWDEYGNINGGLDSKFGVSGPITWSTSNATLSYTLHKSQWHMENQNTTYNISDNLLPQRTIALMGVKDGFSSVLSDVNNPYGNTFIVGSNTVIFGFQPQLAYFYDTNESNRKAMANLMAEPITVFFPEGDNLTKSELVEYSDVSVHKTSLFEDPTVKIVRSIHEDGMFYNFPWFEKNISWFEKNLITDKELINADSYLQQILMNK